MTTGYKILIATGAIVIVSMLLIAAFALGVYVGEHGWTQDGLTLQGPGGPQRPPDGAGAQIPPDRGFPQPDKPPLPGGGRPPDILGRIRDIFEDTLVLATPDGPRPIELDEHTRFETTEGETLPLDALERGQYAAVFGRRNGDGQVLIAELIVLLPPPEQPPGNMPDQPSPRQP